MAQACRTLVPQGGGHREARAYSRRLEYGTLLYLYLEKNLYYIITMFETTTSFDMPMFSIPKCKYGYNAFKGKCNEAPQPKAPSKPWVLGSGSK